MNNLTTLWFIYASIVFNNLTSLWLKYINIGSNNLITLWFMYASTCLNNLTRFWFKYASIGSHNSTTLWFMDASIGSNNLLVLWIMYASFGSNILLLCDSCMYVYLNLENLSTLQYTYATFSLKHILLFWYSCMEISGWKILLFGKHVLCMQLSACKSSTFFNNCYANFRN